MTERLYLGIDWERAARAAGIFDGAGNRVAIASHPLQIFRDEDHVEQAAEDFVAPNRVKLERVNAWLL
jgi:hypothetical protein